MAGQLADDLAQFLAADQVALLPGVGDAAVRAGVSPRVETMGRRLELLWRLRDPRATCPAVIVAGAAGRAPAPRPGRHDGRADRGAPRRRRSIPTPWSRRLVGFGYRREELVEHRGEFARRGAIIDVFPSTADVPIRIDLWGDEVDRLTSFGVNDQRSIADLDEVRIFPARELLPDDDVRERAARLVATEPWGREQWERLAEGAAVRRHGELAAVARRRTTRCSPTCCRPTAKVVLVEPRRMRDRGDRPARRGGRPRARRSPRRGRGPPTVPFPRLHADPDRLLANARCVLDDRLGARSRRDTRWWRRRAGGRSPATAAASPPA